MVYFTTFLSNQNISYSSTSFLLLLYESLKKYLKYEEIHYYTSLSYGQIHKNVPTILQSTTMYRKHTEDLLFLGKNRMEQIINETPHLR